MASTNLRKGLFLYKDYIPCKIFLVMEPDEFEVPKEIREFLPENAKETILGNERGAKKQYRYGKLHILEYDEKYLVHMDKIDPREDPIGHLIQDAPEYLVGLECAAFGNILSNTVSFFKKDSKKDALSKGIATSVIFGYAGYVLTKKIKKLLR